MDASGRAMTRRVPGVPSGSGTGSGSYKGTGIPELVPVGTPQMEVHGA